MGVPTVSGDGVGAMPVGENGVEKSTGGENTGVGEPASMGTVSKTWASIGEEEFITALPAGVGEVQIMVITYIRICIVMGRQAH
ncbi:MAG: hypothetical protein RAP03_15010 [Candidatus Electryonea clarkiae]|nr:hypothetical protein [Candidatus Electryonea clarkiae]